MNLLEMFSRPFMQQALIARASTVTVQIGENEGITQTIQYSVKHTLEILEKQLERIDASSALGMWEFASYVISNSPVVANNVAHMYLALTQGEGSFISSAAAHLWDGEEEKDQAATILERIRKITHPVFGLRDSSDITLYAKWTVQGGISYTVEHYQQNVADNEYTLADKESKTGATGQPSLNLFNPSVWGQSTA